MNEVLYKLIDNAKYPVFAELKQYLENKKTEIDAFDEYINKEQNVKNARSEFINPNGKNTEMFVKDILKGQKILIVMLWTNEMNPKEKKFVNPFYISNKPNEQSECIKTCLEHYGITYTVVTNYKEAIIELNKSTNGKCNYYAVWVINGPQYAILPPNGRRECPGAHLIGQFNDLLLSFWRNGGSVVQWNEGNGLCYQTNLFLGKIRFQDKKGKFTIPTELRLDNSLNNDHKGGQILEGDDSGLLSKNKTFNRKNPETDRFTRLSLAHNLWKIFEGETITYAKDEKTISPFTKFSKDSSGGISTLFYPMVSLDGPGNIIIDCGYTKLFMNMEKEGTFRYVQNIAAWTANVELVVRMGKGIRPRDWRPKAVYHRIIENVIWNGFLNFDYSLVKKELQTIFAIDASFSTHDSELYHKTCKSILNEFYKPGDLIYVWSDSIECITYNNMMAMIDEGGWGGIGTRSELIAEILKDSNFNEHLIIITDGKVGEPSINASDQIMQRNGIKLKHVSSYFVGDDANISVGIPYCRGCTYEAFQVRSENDINKKLSISASAKDLDKFNNMANVSNYQQFLSHYSSFRAVIYSKTAGKGEDETIKRNLESMRGRITQSTGFDNPPDFTEKYNELYLMANGGIKEMEKIVAAATQ